MNLEASTFTKGAPASRASRRAISVLPTPVGPIMMMFFGRISSRRSAATCCRRQRLRSAMATARFARALPDDVAVELGDDLLGVRSWAAVATHSSSTVRFAFV